ncbi:MAG: YqaE/Pmp3 family membrane protein [Chitinophagaceae bacterium]|nr:YqaE/Pmp3 family membrane protein [Chitinophagaceae bacterium]
MKRILILFLAFVLLNPAYGVSVSPFPNDKTEPSVSEAARIIINELSSIPAPERKKRFREARKAIKEYKKAQRSGKQDGDTETLVLVVLAILIPPLAVYLHERELNSKFWITLLLFLLGLAGAFFFSWFLIFVSIVFALLVIFGAV